MRNLPSQGAGVAALAIFAVAAVVLLTGGFATGSAQAQAPTGNEYPAPKPCGPGQDNFPANPAEVISSGHYALFDAYWQRDPRDNHMQPPGGSLNNNLCPPAAKHTERIEFDEKVVITTRTASDIDLRNTIIHVNNTYRADVVATDTEAGTDKLSLDKYEGVRRGLGLSDGAPVPEGTQVYWLRLEDPARNLPPSDLVLGFSAGLLDKKYWEHEDAEGNKLGEYPFQYELEAVRYYGPHTADLPHVLTYWEPELGSGLVWNSLDTDVNSMPLEAGQYEHLEWVFTHPGTYVLEVHLKGHVRQQNPDTSSFEPWEKITDEDTTVTSEVREYTFQVGPLTVNDRPTFGMERSVKENSTAGTEVGGLIRVFTGDEDVLDYVLRGLGSDKFDVHPRATGAQLVVADGAVLDYEAKHTYDLVLGVSDGKDHEGNPEEYFTIDDTTIVQVKLVNVPPMVAVDVNKTNPQVGETVKVRGSYHELQGYVPASASWSIRFVDSKGSLLGEGVDEPQPQRRWRIRSDQH